MVLDADGLNAVSGCTELLLEKKCELILTPHIVEFSRLTGLTVLKIKENPILAAREFAQKFQVTLVLKDAVTVVAAKDGTVSISPSSNSGLATAGSGDVLAGIITGLLSQGARPEARGSRRRLSSPGRGKYRKKSKRRIWHDVGGFAFFRASRLYGGN